MAAIDFKTKTLTIPKRNAGVKGFWPIALDIGYSSVKGFSPNSVFSFPSFIRKDDSKTIGKPDKSNLQYRDETGTYDVGSFAIDMLPVNETKNNSAMFLGRNRYQSRMFLILARVGLAMGMTRNEFGEPASRMLSLQTGLPPAYMISDEPLIREALSGTHHFFLQAWGNDWKEYTLELPKENIQVMPQPMGAMLSVSVNDDCRQLPEYEEYMKSGLLILDGGFGTLDVFDVRNGQILGTETFSEFGMSTVLQQLSKEILRRYGVEISLMGLQKTLEDGIIVALDRRNLSTKRYDITPLLEQYSQEVCTKALIELESAYNNFLDRRYLMAAGGAGAAWYPFLRERYAKMDTLRVVTDPWVNDIGGIFSNARGYYFFLVMSLRAGQIT